MNKNHTQKRIANFSTLVLQTAAASIPDCHLKHYLLQSLTLNKKTSQPCDNTRHPLRDVWKSLKIEKQVAENQRKS